MSSGLDGGSAVGIGDGGERDMSGLRGLAQIFNTLGLLIPTPVLVAIAVGLVLFGVPVWLDNARTREVRGLVRQISRTAQGDESDRLVERAFTVADQRRSRLVELGREAHRRQLTRLRDRAWEQLDRIDPSAGRRERALVVPPATRDRFPLEAQIAVAGMLESGAHGAARTRLTQALDRFPEDSELLALRDRLEAAERAIGNV